MEEQYWNVPLDPQIADPLPPTHQESFAGHRFNNRSGSKNEASIVYSNLYHEASTMVFPSFDLTSVGEIHEDGLVRPWQSIYYLTCAQKGPLAVAPFDFRWNVDDPADIDRLAEALSTECEVKLTLEPWSGFVYDLGVSGTIHGAIALRDMSTNPPSVLISQPFAATRPGAQTSDGPHPISWTVPANANPEALQIRFSGQLSAACGTMRTPPQGLKQIGVKVSQDKAYAPMFAWYGCWPGW